MASRVSGVGLATVPSPMIEAAVRGVGGPKALTGIAIAVLLLPALSFVVPAITLGTGRAHVVQGAVHRVNFAARLFMALVP